MRGGILAFVVMLLCAMPQAAAAQPMFGANRGALFDKPEGLDEWRKPSTVGRLVPLKDMELTPCDRFSTVAFSVDRRATSGMWTGRFSVTQPGTGAWSIVVIPLSGGQPQRVQIDSARQAWQPIAMSTARVQIRLEGPGTAESVCPVVVLESELTADQFSKALGQYGKNDDRWLRTDATLVAQADAAQLQQWGNSVVRLQIATAKGEELPCSGFFITPHILMTARHCVASEDEGRATFLFQPGGAKIATRGTGLLTAQESLDFSLVWVDGDALPAPLTLDAASATALVLWQEPPDKPDSVSVHECAFVRADNERVYHECDTSNGTSGSPVQARATGGVLALHTKGCPDSQHGTPNCQNYGISARQIQARIRELLPDVEGYYPPAAAELKAILSP